MIVKQFDMDYMQNNMYSLLNELGTNIDFTDDIWVCDKYKRSASHDKETYTLYFNRLPVSYREITKFYCLSKGGSISTLNAEMRNLQVFFKFLSENHDELPLKNVTKQHIYDFELYTQSLELSKMTKKDLFPTLRRFFEYMYEHDDMPETIPILNINPYKMTRAEKKVSKKYVPEFVTKQLDIVFKNETIPLHFRLLYWIMRSIPSRVSEVVAMELNCIKAYGSDWVITIPTWKGNGGYIKPQNRLIHVKDEGHGEYLLGLIRSQQEVAKELQSKMPEEERGLLFTVERYQFDHPFLKRTGKMRYVKYNVPPFLISDKSVNLMMNRNIKRFEVVGEDGEVYNLTSHQLRHNGITNRLYEGFSTVEIRDMTGGNLDDSVIYSYFHSVPEKNKEISAKIEGQKAEHLPKEPVYFKGKIMNLDKKTEERILRNPRAYEITDGKDSLGLCTDITGCPSGLFDCLDCNYFAPKVENIEYFEKQVKIWEDKCRLFKNQREALENAKYNLSCYKAILTKIQNSYEDKFTQYIGKDR